MNRAGQVWRELSETGAQCVGLIVSSWHDKYAGRDCHELVILDSAYSVLGTQTWNEDESTGSWDTYEGLERVS